MICQAGEDSPLKVTWGDGHRYAGEGMGINKTAVVDVDQEVKMGEEICAENRNRNIGDDEVPGICFSGHFDLNITCTVCVYRRTVGRP